MEQQLCCLQGRRILAPQVRGGSVIALQQHLRRRGVLPQRRHDALGVGGTRQQRCNDGRLFPRILRRCQPCHEFDGRQADMSAAIAAAQEVNARHSPLLGPPNASSALCTTQLFHLPRLFPNSDSSTLAARGMSLGRTGIRRFQVNCR